MKTNDKLEYLCPYCGAVNEFALNMIRDMYQEQIEKCDCCDKPLMLTAADGVEGAINLVIDEYEYDAQVK
ncbi:CPXCG motif-containing cysteine-rich protein [Alteromonas sp. KUL49]|uniref:CPXCG motif-containing cysteine-rich protein n=1 Tax=Alteromonas sp. KUL49 TaxID=2480798 RepID=UPI00102F0B5A|nr:CPXCG motif-containing cysteine-rich protein [Alteromonas sp. KUL49]TAP42440.1 CPXCG motif-containing cysteine-rich protein [Alteromonas sp. KUL49]GEA10062.1 hypothetical protein KUL49_04370 [Alteromonas sp. KUL49]